ncbi:DNMT3B, partial [Symbiodinium pilosum]
MLRPLRLSHSLQFRPSVPVNRLGEGLHKQELCFIRVVEAPPPPPEQHKPYSVRIGGGFYIPEVHRSAVQAAKDAAQRVKERSMPQRGRSQRLSEPSVPSAQSARPPDTDGGSSCSGQAAGPVGPVLLGRSASPDKKRLETEQEEAEVQDYVGTSQDKTLPSGFLHGEPNPAAIPDVEGAGFRFGTYTRGEQRSHIGDRRQCAGKTRCEDYVGPAPYGDGAFRVLSSERRHSFRRLSTGSTSEDLEAAFNARKPNSRKCSKEAGGGARPASEAPGTEALAALLQALGHEYDEASVTRPDIHKTECVVGGKWRVELLYMYADCPTEKKVEVPVEVTVEKEVPFIVEVERSRGVEASTGSQTTALWCAYCGAPGHSIAECPLLRLQQQVRQLELDAKNHKHQDCQLCGDAEHLAPNCPTLRRATCFDACVQTDLQCQLCDRTGHLAKQCPMLAALMQKSDGATARIRVGGGWLIAPQVPGLGEPGLNEAEAIQALAAANAAGAMTKDGQVVYGKSRSPSRPRSAPSGESRSVSPRSPQAQTPSPQRTRESPRTSAPKDQSRILAAGPMGPERFKAMEQERAALSERIREGQGKAPDQHRGFLYGTFVQGGHDKHRFSSDRGARSMYRVYRSSVSQDSALDPSELQSSRRSSTAAKDEVESGSDAECE